MLAKSSHIPGTCNRIRRKKIRLDKFLGKIKLYIKVLGKTYFEREQAVLESNQCESNKLKKFIKSVCYFTHNNGVKGTKLFYMKYRI